MYCRALTFGRADRLHLLSCGVSGPIKNRCAATAAHKTAERAFSLCTVPVMVEEGSERGGKPLLADESNRSSLESFGFRAFCVQVWRRTLTPLNPPSVPHFGLKPLINGWTD